MKVGIIGLNKLGLVLSRKMIENGIEVWGYDKDYDFANKVYENKKIDGITTSIEYLVSTVKNSYPLSKNKGIFITIDPIEEINNELLSLLNDGDIVIDYSRLEFEDFRSKATSFSRVGIEYIDFSIISGFCGMDDRHCIMVGGTNTAVSTCYKIFDSFSSGDNYKWVHYWDRNNKYKFLNWNSVY